MKKNNFGIILILVMFSTCASLASSTMWICLNSTMYKLNVPSGIMTKIMDSLFFMAGPGALCFAGLGITIITFKFIEHKVKSFLQQKKPDVLLDIKAIEA